MITIYINDKKFAINAQSIRIADTDNDSSLHQRELEQQRINKGFLSSDCAWRKQNKL